MRKIIVAVFLTGILFATPAAADWHYAKWGMTESQIIAASKGEARKYRQQDSYDHGCPFNGLKPMAVVPTKNIGGVAFKITFCSNGDGHLSIVSLDGDGANIFMVRRALLGQYGRPVSDIRGETVWRDKAHGNVISLLNIADISARIVYKPIAGGF